MDRPVIRTVVSSERATATGGSGVGRGSDFGTRPRGTPNTQELLVSPGQLHDPSEPQKGSNAF